MKLIIPDSAFLLLLCAVVALFMFKACGLVTCSWAVVLAPLWIPAAMVAAIPVVALAATLIFGIIFLAVMGIVLLLFWIFKI